MAGACICGKAYDGLSLVSEGTCHWCGHGDAALVTATDRRRDPRLPRDLGALQREGRRVPLRFPNVVYLDRLRSLRWRRMGRAA